MILLGKGSASSTFLQLSLFVMAGRAAAILLKANAMIEGGRVNPECWGVGSAHGRYQLVDAGCCMFSVYHQEGHP